MNNQDYVGELIDGRYRLNKLLGRGGMGAVYLGYHINIGRRVAVKILSSTKNLKVEDVLRFHREARAAAAIGHKGIIDVFDVGNTARGDPYLVMEFLEGESLETMIERLAPFELPTAIAIGEHLLLALAAAHDKGVIHRDITPGNIFLVYEDQASQPAVKLIDFGVSKITNAAGVSRLTQAGTFLGTLAYVAPEQAMADLDVDHRVDLYSVGVVLYEMLTGELPFTGTNFNMMMLNIVSRAPRPPMEVNASFPIEAGPLLERALDKDPSARFQTAVEMLEGLRGLCSVESRERSLGKLTSVLSRSHCAWGDIGDSDAGDYVDESPLLVAQRDGTYEETPPASQEETQSAYRLWPWKGLGRTTRRVRTMFSVSLGIVVVLLFFVGWLMFKPEPAAPPLAADLAPAEPLKAVPTAVPTAVVVPAEVAPAEVDGLTPPLSAALDDSVERQESDTAEEAAPARKAARGKRPAKAKPNVQPNVRPNVKRFIKGGRQTEIAQEFE